MIFTYWEGPGGPSDEMTQRWREVDPDFRVHSLDDLHDAVMSLDPSLWDMVTQIRLPAARSDLARLVLLERHGGFYVDAHTLPGNPEALTTLLAACDTRDLILFDREPLHASPGDIHLINGVLAGRAGAPATTRLRERVASKLHHHRDREIEAGGYVKYNLAVLTGAWNLRTTFISTLPDGSLGLSPEVADEVMIWGLTDRKGVDPIRLYASYEYRTPETHWSNRQRSEMLFGGPGNRTLTQRR